MMCSKRYYIIGILFTLILGTLLHFTYQWSEQNFLVGIFSANSESLLQHAKLIVTPMLLYTLYGVFQCSESKRNFVTIQLISILIAVITMLGLYTLYTELLGKHFLAADIVVFILAVIVGYLHSASIHGTD